MKNISRIAMMFVGLMIGGPGSVSAVSYYAAQNGQVPGDFRSWGAAASNIQDAVNAAGANDTVWVGAGTYTVPTNAVVYLGTNVVYINRPLTLRSSNGVPESVVIDGGGIHRGLVMSCSLGTTNRVVVDGFTIAGGYATNHGGGIYMVPGTYTGVVQNCRIIDNTAVLTGGGIAVPETFSAFNYVISDCLIRGNQAGTGGGFMTYIRAAGRGGWLSRCIIESNRATNGYGGGLLLTTGSNVLDSCVIRANQSTTTGGGVLSRGGVLQARNCLIYNNAPGTGGGGFYLEANLAASFQNCTIVSNRGATYAGGVRMQETSVILQVCNSIIYSNSGNNVTGGTPWYTNSCIYPMGAGSNNTTNPPAFVDFANQDFHLTRGSPCVNTGTNADWMTGAVDLDGRPRIDQGSLLVDMGCYEYVFPGGTLILTR